MEIQHSQNLQTLDPLETLKNISGYDDARKKKADFRLGFFSSREIKLNKSGQVVVAPHSFFGHLLGWLVPYRGAATGKDYQQQNKLKKAIQNMLPEELSQDREVKYVISQVFSKAPQHAITQQDLRKIIDIAEKRKKAFQKTEKKAALPLREVSSETTKVLPFVREVNSGHENSLSILSSSPVDNKEMAIKEALTLIETSTALLKKQTFDPKEVLTLRNDITKQRKAIEAVTNKINFQHDDSDKWEEEKATSFDDQDSYLSQEILQQLEEERDHLIMRENMLSQYLEGDPFNDKNVLYPQRIYAEAAKVIFEANINSVPQNQQKGLSDKFYLWYHGEITPYQQADSSKRSNPPEFYLDKNNRENPLAFNHSQRVVNQLNSLFGGKNAISLSEVEKAVGVALTNHLTWETTKRDMFFSRQGQRAAYRQVSTPLSQTDSSVGSDLLKNKIYGIPPFVRNHGKAPINARMTQLFSVKGVIDQFGKKVEEEILLHERQQHGVNDHFEIRDSKERQKANENSMRQLIQSGAEADPAFITDAIKEHDAKHQIFYINTNLTTPTWTPRGPKNDEYTYSLNQGKAMKAVEGKQPFFVQDPQNGTRLVKREFNVTCIDFRFPVNYVISDVREDVRAIDPGMTLAWSELKTHNEGEFRKFFGSLDVEAPLGGLLKDTYEKLSKAGEANPQGEEARLALEIKKQVNYLRRIFQNETYQRAGHDRFKMPRHIDLLVNAFRRAAELVDDHKVRIVNAGGCMSGKDREGVANAENEAAIIIQDLGGTVAPDQINAYSPEEKYIYDSCVTGVVYNTRQVTGIGGSKNAQEIANQMSDQDARIYAQGASIFTSN